MTPIDDIKTRINIVDLVGETFTIRPAGRLRTTVEHDSLKLWPDANTWYWFSRGQGGDVLDWYQHIHQCDFRTALADLAQRAGVELRPLTAEEQAARNDAEDRRTILRLAAGYYHAILQHPTLGAPGRHYCSGRGWTMRTIQREMLGFCPGDNNALSDNDQVPGIQPLSAGLREAGLIDHPVARAVLSIPPNMIVYVHRRRGQPVYLSGRSIDGKRHYNPPADLMGPRQPYIGNAVAPYARATLLVEGQADAIACAELDIQAVALCGVDGDELNLDGITHVAFDNDDPGRRRAVDFALERDPLLRIFPWPKKSESKDLAEMISITLRKSGQDGPKIIYDLMIQLLSAAEPALWHLAQRAGRAAGDERNELITRFFDHYTQLDELVATDLRPSLADQLCGGISQFNRLLKAHKKKTDGEQAERFEYSAGGVRGGHIWEQCIVIDERGNRRSNYAIKFPDGKIQMKAMLELANTTYIPYPVHLGIIDADVVMFPEQPADYGSARQLVNDVQSFIHRYLDIDVFYEKLAAYYVLFSWLYDLFENLPYLRALGDYGTGKTRFLQTIGVLCYRPMFVSGASSVSPIFRLIDMFNGTLVIDEADFANSDAESEIIKIMNVGYYRNGVVLRAEKDQASSQEQWSPQVYKVYGPKIMATRRPFTDRATESRCLTKRMTTARPRPEIPYILGADFWRSAQDLRNKLLRYRLDHHREIHLDHSLADESVEPRLNQVTMALKSIVDPEMREEIDTFVRAYNNQLIADRQMTLPAIVVQALAKIHFNSALNVLGEDTRDFTMKGIGDMTRTLLADIDPDTKVYPRLISKILSEELGLTRRGRDTKTSRSRLEYEEDELFALMARYGIDRPQ